MQGCRCRCACGNCHFPHFFLLFHCHRHHASFPHDHDVPSRTLRHNGRFGVEAAKSMAPMPTGMLFLTSLGMHNQLLVHYPPYSYARHNPQQPHNAHQCVGRWWPPWCPITSATAHYSHPAYWLIFVCGGAGSEAPWWPWDEGSHHGRWVHGLASFS